MRGSQGPCCRSGCRARTRRCCRPCHPGSGSWPKMRTRRSGHPPTARALPGAPAVRGERRRRVAVSLIPPAAREVDAQIAQKAIAASTAVSRTPTLMLTYSGNEDPLREERRVVRGGVAVSVGSAVVDNRRSAQFDRAPAATAPGIRVLTVVEIEQVRRSGAGRAARNGWPNTTSATVAGPVSRRRCAGWSGQSRAVRPAGAARPCSRRSSRRLTSVAATSIAASPALIARRRTNPVPCACWPLASGVPSVS